MTGGSGRKETSWKGLSRQNWTRARSDAMTGRSQNVCLDGSWSGGVSDRADQSDKYSCEVTVTAATWTTYEEKSLERQDDRSKHCRKAGRASDASLLTPRPPYLTGKEAWSQWTWESLKLVIWQTVELNWLSNILSAGWSLDEELRNRCKTLGPLKDARSKIGVSWELMFLILSTALLKSSHRKDQALSTMEEGDLQFWK